MKVEEKMKAIKLRKRGFSMVEIAEKLLVSKSSVSWWVRGIELSDKAKKKIEAKLTNGQIASQKAKYAQTTHKERVAIEKALALLSSFKMDKKAAKILCAMIYYCEGEKSIKRGITFTNSDPDMIKLFLQLFRDSFVIQEDRLRVCVHLHSYHDKDTQLKFWSKTTTIPLRQFIKPYQKAHSGKYKKEGYQGCIHVSYHDVAIAREMRAVAIEFMKRGL